MPQLNMFQCVLLNVANNTTTSTVLSTGDWIQIIAILISTAISVISIAIAVATLKQTNKITKEANRAYLVATLEYTAFGGIKNYYLVIKNYGNSAATLNNITCSREIDFLGGLEVFENLKNTSIAPHQSITSACYFEQNRTPFSLTIEYKQDKDTYTETFTINPIAIVNILYSNMTKLNMQLPEALANSTNELIRSRM